MMLAVLMAQPIWRFGNGGEYYALYLAALEYGRPFMIEDAWRDYAALAADGRITSMVDPGVLRAAYPMLADAQTADFDSFWFYPACAALVAAPLKLVGIVIFPHTAFLALHALLFGATLALAGRLDGVHGTAAAALLFLASPIVWFATKAHTEFFTVALMMQAFILVRRGKLFYAALPVALASTQNISLMPTAWTLVLFGLLSNHILDRSTRLREFTATVVAVLTTLLHPLYFLYRHGILTPQPEAGGTPRFGGNADHLLAVLIDPDIGLFPNWWFGCAVLVACIALALHRRPKTGFAYIAVAAIYLATTLFAQMFTANLNSGSIDLSRNALWYIPIFYAPLAWLIDEATHKPLRWLAVLPLVAAAPLAAWNLNWYWPTHQERYTRPSALSRILQSQFPAIYDPPPEVFLERNSGYGEAAAPLAAIAGPGCRKLYIPGELLKAKAIRVVSQNGCELNQDKVGALIAEHLTKQPLQDPSKGVYVQLDDEDLERLRLKFASGRIALNAGAQGVSTLTDGWSAPESWGTWSVSTRPRIEIPLEDCNSDVLQVVLGARGFALAQNPHVAAAVMVDGRKVGSYDFTQVSSDAKPLEFEYACADARKAGNALTLNFEIDGAAMPSELGLGSDNRLLGIGVEWIDIQRRPAAAQR